MIEVMYDYDTEMARTLGRIEGKLDMLIDRGDKAEDRIHAVEKKVWFASGLGVLCSVALSKWLGLGLPH